MSRSHEEHLQHLRQLFEVLRRARLSINLEKCVFGKHQVDYLDFTVSQDGYQTRGVPQVGAGSKIFARALFFDEHRSFPEPAKNFRSSATPCAARTYAVVVF